MASSTISINLGASAGYARVVGSKFAYSGSTAELHDSKNGLEIRFTANDAKSLFSAMGSVMRQLTIVGNAMGLVERQQARRPSGAAGKHQRR